jgi:hypothetical protein
MNSTDLSSTQKSASTDFTLTVHNDSTLMGESYIYIFPAAMGVEPLQPQTTVPMSAPVLRGNNSSTSISWSDALALIVLTPGQCPDEVAPIPVELGSNVLVTWDDGSFSVTPSTAVPELATTITATFGPDFPQFSIVGLVKGPGRTMVPVPANGMTLTLTPIMTPVYKLQFGMHPPLGQSNFSDFNPAVFMACTGAGATITIGADNLFTQTPPGQCR